MSPLGHLWQFNHHELCGFIGAARIAAAIKVLPGTGAERVEPIAGGIQTWADSRLCNGLF